MPVAKTQFSELVPELNRVLSAPFADHTFALARIEREALKMRESHPVESAMLLGGIATARGDIAELRHQIQSAMGRAPGVAIIRQNAATFLEKVALFTEALAHARAAHKLENNPQSRGYLVHHLFAAGRYQEAMQVIHGGRATLMDHEKWLEKLMERICALGKSLEVTDDQTEQLQNTVVSILHEQGVRKLETSVRPSADSGNAAVAYFCVPGINPERAVQLNCALADGLAATDLPASATGLITYVVTSASVGRKDADKPGRSADVR